MQSGRYLRLGWKLEYVEAPYYGRHEAVVVRVRWLEVAWSLQMSSARTQFVKTEGATVSSGSEIAKWED